VPVEKGKSERSEFRERLLGLYLYGKLSGDKIGKLEKFLSIIDGYA